jgi:hypothetical protein
MSVPYHKKSVKGFQGFAAPLFRVLFSVRQTFRFVYVLHNKVGFTPVFQVPIQVFVWKFQLQ